MFLDVFDIDLDSLAPTTKTNCRQQDESHGYRSWELKRQQQGNQQIHGTRVKSRFTDIRRFSSVDCWAVIQKTFIFSPDLFAAGVLINVITKTLCVKVHVSWFAVLLLTEWTDSWVLLSEKKIPSPRVRRCVLSPGFFARYFFIPCSIFKAMLDCHTKGSVCSRHSRRHEEWTTTILHSVWWEKL